MEKLKETGRDPFRFSEKIFFEEFDNTAVQSFPSLHAATPQATSSKQDVCGLAADAYVSVDANLLCLRFPQLSMRPTSLNILYSENKFII